MGAESIKKELEHFQSSLKKLSSGISNASSLWNDSKYSELSAAVSTIANDSKDFVMRGNVCCKSLDKFKKISEEKY